MDGAAQGDARDQGKLPDDERDARRLVERLNGAEVAVRAVLPEIHFSFVEPDVAD